MHKIVPATLVALFVALLVACGGGGGGPTEAPGAVNQTPRAEAFSATPDTCTVPSAATGCQVTLSGKTAYTTDTKVVAGNQSVPVPPNGEFTVTVMAPVGEQVFQLMNGTTELDRVVVTARCATGSYNTGNGCGPKLTYEKGIVGLMGDPYMQYPVKISGSSCSSMTVVPAANRTKYQAGVQPYINTLIYERPLPSGLIPVSAQMEQDGYARHEVVYNYPTNELVNYGGEEGLLPSTNPLDPGWKAAQFGSVIPTEPARFGFFAYTGTGELIFIDRDPTVLLCKELATGVITEVGRFPSGFINLTAYSN